MLKEHHCRLCTQHLPCAATWITNLQTKLVHVAQESPKVTNSEVLIEPTLVLQFPSQTASGMQHNLAAACATDKAAQAQNSGLMKGIAQQLTISTGSDCGAAQDCNQMADSLSNPSTAAPHGHVKDVHMLPAPCLQPMAAVNRCEAGGAERQQSDATETDGNAFTSCEQPNHETIAVSDGQNASPEGQATAPGGQATTPDGQNGSSEGQATFADAQSGSLEGRATVPDGQHACFEGQTAIADGAAAKTDGQGLHVDATVDKQTALADGVPAVLDDTISEACCVCKSAEDGEVMLLCDKCDQPAHLGCVGVETVPEGDWFCPSCTPAMVSISILCGTRPHPHSARPQHHVT